MDEQKKEEVLEELDELMVSVRPTTLTNVKNSKHAHIEGVKGEGMRLGDIENSPGTTIKDVDLEVDEQARYEAITKIAEIRALVESDAGSSGDLISEKLSQLNEVLDASERVAKIATLLGI